MSTPPIGPVLLGIDVHGIQSYLFATSKLKEIIGASRIVDDFTGDQPDDVPAQLMTALGLTSTVSGAPTGDRWYVPVRLGGGVVRLLLPNDGIARRFVRLMSEWALVHANGLAFDADWVTYDLSAGNYAEANTDLVLQINAKRQAISRGSGFNGFPFSAPCRLTGDPAEGYDGRNERLCAASLDKRTYQARRDDRWASVKDESILKAFKVDDVRRPFILDLESMQGEAPADAYMAVVALDLNSLGDKGKALVDNAKGVEALHLVRGFVENVAAATSAGFGEALNSLANNPDSPHEFATIARMVDHSGKLPLRPLVFGGDDLTFVMHSVLAPRFAFCLASSLVKAGYSSGVGIAFVKTRSPLSRAMDLAEALLARAKRAGRDKTHIDFMLCSAEIPPDASDRDPAGDRAARGPYDLPGFQALMHNAGILKHELPSSHIRGAVDGFRKSRAAGRELLDDLIENIDRGLGGGARATKNSRELLGTMKSDDAIAATYLDCVDLFRFIAPRPDRGDGARSDAQRNEVIA